MPTDPLIAQGFHFSGFLIDVAAIAGVVVLLWSRHWWPFDGDENDD